MALPNSSHPAATGLTLLADSAGGFLDYVTEASPVVTGGAFPTETTPFGDAIIGNQVSYLDYGARPDIAATGDDTQTMMQLFVLKNYNDSVGALMGKVGGNWGLIAQASSGLQQFLAGFIDGSNTVGYPSTTIFNGILPFNGHVVCMVSTYDGVNAKIAVRDLTADGPVFRTTVAKTGTFPNNATTAFNLMARGNGANAQNAGASLIAAGTWNVALAEATVDDLLDDPLALFTSPDETPPLLSNATTSAVTHATAVGSITTNEPGPGWAVLTTSATKPTATQVKAGQDHLGVSTPSSSASLALGVNTDVFNFSGATQGTLYYMHVVQDDLAFVTNTSLVATSPSFTTPLPDTTNPTQTGPITVVAKTSSSITFSWPVGADNDLVDGYEISTNGGTDYVDVGDVLSTTAQGLSELTGYNLAVRNYDRAGLRSNAISLSTTTYRNGASAGSIRATTGPQNGGLPGLLYAFCEFLPVDTWVSFTVVAGPTPPGGTLDVSPNGDFLYVGPEPATLEILPETNGVAAAESLIANLYVTDPEGPTPPVLTGSLSLDDLTHNSAALTIPVATDTVSVAYEYKLSTSSVWIDLATSRAIALAALAEATEYTVQARAYNPSGLRSSVLSYTFTTEANPLTTAVLSNLVVTNYGADMLELSISSTHAADCYVSVTTTNSTPTHEDVITGVGAVATDVVTLATGPNPAALTTSALPPGTYYVHVALGDGITVISNVLTTGPLTIVAVTKFATLVLRDRTGALLPDLRGLMWAWWDTYPPNLHAAPVATGVASTHAVTGAMTVGVYGTGLTFGEVGTLAVLKGDGVVGSSQNKAFFGPVAIDPGV